MKILICEPHKRPYIKDIDHTLENLQEVVGGYIQALYPFDDDAAVICNEEGLLMDLEPNRIVDRYGVIFGTFFICGLTEDDFKGLTDEQIEQYTELYKTPEMFMRIADKVIVNPEYD
ncbi:DUF3846 domain-containing protein [Ruminococcus sp.]|uniref:DUF3846 domain-containing protein n=1 Tax=Ruminococcus sp. TaxID=41978 RepID=UPI0025EC6F5F|nr:DUF3846 domain-containing protein [Ruminococcus sp.]